MITAKVYLESDWKVTPEKLTMRSELPCPATKFPEKMVPETVPLAPPPRTVADAIEMSQAPGFESEKDT